MRMCDVLDIRRVVGADSAASRARGRRRRRRWRGRWCVFLRRACHCSTPPRPVIWLGPSCHLCAAVARPSLAGYRLEPPSLAPVPPANRISSRRHCIPATLKRIRFSRCENDAFLPRALLPAPAGLNERGATQDKPTDPLIITLFPFHFATDTAGTIVNLTTTS